MARIQIKPKQGLVRKQKSQKALLILNILSIGLSVTILLKLYGII